MTNYDETLALIKYCLHGGEVPRITDFETVYGIFQSHAIVPLLFNYDREQNLDLPQNIKDMLQNEKMQHYFECIQMSEAVGALTRLFEENGAKAVILKGFSAAKYYDGPECRTFGDIDFMVRDIDFEKAEKLMAENGYEPEKTTEGKPEYIRHATFYKDGYEYEMHRYFSQNVTESDRLVDKEIENAEYVKSEILDTPFYSFEDTANGFVLLEHINHHIIGGIGFRQIIDWFYYVEKYLTDEVWNKNFGQKAENLKFRALAAAVTGMGEIYFGMSHRDFADEASEKTVKMLFEEIMSSGNFGVNKEKNDSSMVTFTQSGNVFKRLQKGGMCRWEAAWKHKWLRPFAWLYQLVRVSGIMLGRIFSGKKIRDDIKMKQEYDELFHRLEVGKWRNE